MANKCGHTSGINYIGDIRREYHHIKAISGSGEEEYEPAMMIFRESAVGRSFWVPMSCLWKYLEPHANKDMVLTDQRDFNELARKIYHRHRYGIRSQQSSEDAAAVVMAESINASTGIMLCTAFSLVKCCQLLDITVCGPALVQLLMFIQDGLDDLKNMPEAEPEERVAIGEVAVKINGKTVHQELTLSESDLTTGFE